MTTTDEEYLTAGGGSDTEVEGKASNGLMLLNPFFRKCHYNNQIAKASSDDLAESLPKISFFNKGPMHIPLLSSLSLSCEVTGILEKYPPASLECLGVPEPDVKWFREGNMLTSGKNGYQIRKICNGKWNLFVNQESFKVPEFFDHEENFLEIKTGRDGTWWRVCNISV